MRRGACIFLASLILLAGAGWGYPAASLSAAGIVPAGSPFGERVEGSGLSGGAPRYSVWRDAAFSARRTAVEHPPRQSSVPAAGLDVSGWRMLWVLLAVFAGGVALNLTPCVYPLIPVTISYFGGRSDHAAGGLGLAAHGLLYLAGMALMNSMLGVFAALSGHLLGMVLQNPFTLIFVSAVLLGFALSMFGFWEFRLPGFVTGIAAKNYAGYFGSLFMGLTVGLIAAPCVGPFVVGLLVWVAATGNPWFGFVVFFSLSLGMGLPLFVLAVLSGQMKKLPRSGEWMIWVRKLMGWILVGMAAYFLRPLLSDFAGLAVLAATAVAAGIHLGWIDSSEGGFPAFGRVKKAVGIFGIGVAFAVVWSGAVLPEGIRWLPYSNLALAEAKASGKPVIIDFYADWCSPCKMMDRVTFRDGSVVKAAEDGFVTLQVDLTRRGDSRVDELLRRFDVRGVPTVIFLEPGGEERKDLRVQEFVPPERFLPRMEAVKKAPPVAAK